MFVNCWAGLYLFIPEEYNIGNCHPNVFKFAIILSERQELIYCGPVRRLIYGFWNTPNKFPHNFNNILELGRGQTACVCPHNTGGLYIKQRELNLIKGACDMILSGSLTSYQFLNKLSLNYHMA